MTRRKKAVVWGLAAAVGSVAILLVAYQLHQITQAELTLHSMICTIEAIREHVEDTNEWPSSWSNLDGRSRYNSSMYSLPKDRDEVASRVEVDFSLTVCEVADLSAENFNPVKPRGISYHAYEYRIPRLIESAQRACRKEGYTSP